MKLSLAILMYLLQEKKRRKIFLGYNAPELPNEYSK
jgi:hypothetical protein